MAYKLRLIHGGADAKALLLVAVLIPSWFTFVPINGDYFVPPVFALLVWGGLGFFLLPISLVNLLVTAGLKLIFPVAFGG